MAIIWIAYKIAFYTSYVVGALSFSFVFYLSILLWVLRRKKTLFLSGNAIKYANKSIASEEAQVIEKSLKELLEIKEWYKNPNLKLANVAKELNITQHQLSQFLNDNLNKSFNLFINEYRIEASKEFLKTDNKYTAEAIGYQCGFNSKSTFFTTFKKITGFTPSQFREL